MASYISLPIDVQQSGNKEVVKGYLSALPIPYKDKKNLLYQWAKSWRVKLSAEDYAGLGR